MLMKVAIPQWNGRVSPVFDVAGSLLLVEVADGEELRRQEGPLTATGPLSRARQVVQFGAEVLICGAISLPLEAALASTGMQVIPYTCGSVEQVLGAFINQLEDFVAEGLLTPEQAETLIATAEWVLGAIATP